MLKVSNPNLTLQTYWGFTRPLNGTQEVDFNKSTLLG